ncbi:Hsp20/alpha crystallin family protein [Haliscomenobacter sp.]|uniref:Hsp20/alpha crystallin family protein n=1 Tax=Haliscomenobacter sp. TaxID=2717303 RepID=UPI0035937D60
MKVITVKPQVPSAFVDKSFDHLINRFFGPEVSFGPFRDWVENRPAVNIVETETNFRIELAAPGLNKEDFNIKVEKDTLSISAKKESATVEGEKVKVREFAYSSFQRNFTLPKTVNAEAIEARYENGVLFLTVPKQEEAQPKSRQITIG